MRRPRRYLLETRYLLGARASSRRARSLNIPRVIYGRSSGFIRARAQAREPFPPFSGGLLFARARTRVSSTSVIILLSNLNFSFQFKGSIQNHLDAAAQSAAPLRVCCGLFCRSARRNSWQIHRNLRMRACSGQRYLCFRGFDSLSRSGAFPHYYDACQEETVEFQWEYVCVGLLYTFV